ncbi:hypothetical protein BGW38_008575 [Lunasporangiospora selenospora]|uniref:Uncharacterized protein n=1 Tax=Lunasporangiospora selenospora TaxID=979761 RepID=A0A9P6FZZ6_9FUNG|nr:hypothetical protein BGW38_008575 [Lunasporangiospora selenospora]
MCVFDLFDSRTKLHQLYGVAFHYLTFETLRPHLCHLLYYLTTRDDVKIFRIRKLLELQINVGKEPPLLGLLYTYRSYFPNLILAPLPTTNRITFKCPDEATATLIQELQEKWSILSTDTYHEIPLDGSKAPISKLGAKRQKLSHSSIPDTLSIYNKGPNVNSLPLSQITSLDSLVGHLDSLTLPDQVSSILSSRLLQHVLCLQPSQAVVERISYWLEQELMDLWYWTEKTELTKKRFSTLLAKVVEVTTTIKDILPVIEKFLVSFIRVWDGVEHRKEIFTLLTYIRPRSYEEIYVNYFKPLHKIFHYMGPIWKSELILCYTGLLKRWAQINWKDFITFGNEPGLSEEAVDVLCRLFSSMRTDVDYMQMIRSFIEHVDSISSTALEMEHDHISVQHGVLSFFDLVSSLTGTHQLPLAVVVPDSTIVYRCYLSDNGMAISRICRVIYQYKQAFEAFEHEQQMEYERLIQLSLEEHAREHGEDSEKDPEVPVPPEVPGYSRDYVIQFNSLVMDICNFIWRNRAFNKTDKNARGFLVDSNTVGHVRQVCADGGLAVNNMLSLTHSAAFAGFSARFLSTLEDQYNIPAEKRLRAPASNPALKDMMANGGLNIAFEDYRVQYLDYLEQEGFEGVCRFLYDCITNLVQRKLQSLEMQRQERSLEMQRQERSFEMQHQEQSRDI